MVLVGAGGFAKQLIEVLCQKVDANRIFVFDGVNKNKRFYDFKMIHEEQDVIDVFNSYDKDFCLGIGNPHLREKFANRFKELGGYPFSVVSDHAFISKNAHLEAGVSVLTSAIVENSTFIGEGSLVNCQAIVHHDVEVGKFCEIAPGAKLLGSSKIGNNCFVGAGAIIMPKINIGDNVIIGAGALVTKDVESDITVTGIPAKPYIK